MSINSDWNGGAGVTFTRSQLRFALAFGQSNVQEGSGTAFVDLEASPADTELLYGAKPGVSGTHAGDALLDWGNIRGSASGRFGAMVQFLRRRYALGENNWCGHAHSRSGFPLADDGGDHYLDPELETVHIRSILDQFGKLLGYSAGHTNPINVDLLWYMQGETDTNNATYGDAWKTNFRELLSRMEDAGLTFSRIVFSKISSEYSANPGYAAVQAGIEEISQELSNATLIDSEATQYDVTNHADSIGQMLVGERLSAAYDNLIGL